MTTAKKKKKKTICIKFTPKLNDPIFPKGHVSRRMCEDARIASPWVEDYVEKLWPEGYERKDAKGNDGVIGGFERVEIRTLKAILFFGFSVCVGAKRIATYETLMESMTYRDCFLIADIRKPEWKIVKIPKSTILDWIEEGVINDKGNMPINKFWPMVERDFDVSYSDVYLG